MRSSKTSKVSTADFLPLLSVKDNTIISKNADLTLCYKMELPPSFTLDDKGYVQIHQLWLKVIDLLPSGSIIHKQDWFTEAPYQATANSLEETDNILKRCYDQHFENQSHLHHQCYLFFTLSIQQHSPTQALRILQQGTNTQTQSDFYQKVQQCIALMNQSGLVSLTALTQQELLGDQQQNGLLSHYLNLSCHPKAPLVDLRLKDHPFCVGDQKVCIFSLSDPKDLPPWVSTSEHQNGYSSPMAKLPLSFVNDITLGLQGNHIYNQYICIDKKQSKIESFESQSKAMASLAPFSSANVHNKQWIDQYLEELYQNNHPSVRAHFNLMCYSQDPNEFEDLKIRAQNALTKLNCTLQYHSVDTPLLYYWAIPGNAGALDHNLTFHSFAPQALCFFQNDSLMPSTTTDFGIQLCDRRNLKPMVVDLCEQPMKKGIINNRNKFILGPSGSGKSFFTNHMLRHYYNQGAHIVLIDVGNSYQGLTQIIKEQSQHKDGAYFTYTHQNPICFNPFYQHQNDFDIEKIESLKTLLLCLWKKDHEPVTRAEETTLYTAITAYTTYLKTQKKKGSFDDFYNYMQGPYAKSLQESGTREKEFDLHNFLHTLAPFYKGGAYHYLLNSEKPIDLLQNRFIVFEIDAIKGAPV